MSARSAEPDSRDNSPDHEGSPGGRRTSKKRKVLSCYACRNRKMKCDRVYPVCGRCQTTGRADQCTYDPRLLEDGIGVNGVHANGQLAQVTLPDAGTQLPMFGGSSTITLQSKARAQERRIEELERKLAAKQADSSISHFQDLKTPEPDTKKEMMFRGKGFKTQFNGSTSVMSLIGQVLTPHIFRELQAFTREALTVDHSIMRVKSDFKTFRDRRKKAQKHYTTRTFGTDEEVLAALPDRTSVDLQVATYFRHWETAYRILHEPSFWKEYAAFWEQRAAGLTQPGFAVMLLLMIASTVCLTPKDDVFEGDTTADRQMASNIIDICEAWNGRQPRKRLTLQFFQLQCLLLLAKRANCVRLKQDWVASGDLVRLALASGMHRNPSLLSTGKISPFEKEMKKRLWVTIMELEMQSSLESGLQSSLTALYWDTPAPANLPDDAFSIDTQELPASRPIDHFTSSSYLGISRTSIPLRLQLMQLLNDPSEDMPYSEVLHYDAQIHDLLSNLPKWDDSRAKLPSELLQLQLRQYLIILHRPYAILAPNNNRYVYSFTACIDAAGSVITKHNELVTKGILVLNNMRNDIIRVGLILSKVIYHNCNLVGSVKPVAPPPPFGESHFVEGQAHIAEMLPVKELASGVEVALAVLPTEPFLTRTLCPSGLDLLDLAGQIFEQKVMRMGTAYMEYWLLTAAIGMLPPPSSAKPPAASIAHITSPTDDLDARCRKTLDRFVTLTFRVLALQKDPENTLASSLRTTMASVSPSDIRTPKSVGENAPIAIAGFGTSNAATDSNYSAMPGMSMGMGVEPAMKDMNGTFDTLDDMQVDLGGWNFPDFWAFDLGGDF
ncbi:fungal-specific transcription factor domain-containing protein [Phaeosphaeria sp. MPI-PUGE-AT-0046c]|nr:fungal-specific transcription factor domain-containing protein [Phaeosphaeria sp. MPI-PUGE-AT-0046c]